MGRWHETKYNIIVVIITWSLNNSDNNNQSKWWSIVWKCTTVENHGSWTHVSSQITSGLCGSFQSWIIFSRFHIRQRYKLYPRFAYYVAIIHWKCGKRVLCYMPDEWSFNKITPWLLWLWMKNGKWIAHQGIFLYFET